MINEKLRLQRFPIHELWARTIFYDSNDRKASFTTLEAFWIKVLVGNSGGRVSGAIKDEGKWTFVIKEWKMNPPCWHFTAHKTWRRGFRFSLPPHARSLSPAKPRPNSITLAPANKAKKGSTRSLCCQPHKKHEQTSFRDSSQFIRLATEERRSEKSQEYNQLSQ